LKGENEGANLRKRGGELVRKWRKKKREKRGERGHWNLTRHAPSSRGGRKGANKYQKKTLKKKKLNTNGGEKKDNVFGKKNES